jgi:putative transposase
VAKGFDQGWSSSLSLRRAVADYMSHYHAERNHQCLANQLIQTSAAATASRGAIHRRARLGGKLNFYYRKAA